MLKLCRESANENWKNQKKKMDDAGEPAPEDGDIEELSDPEMLLNRESNPGLPRLVGVNDKRKS